MKNTTFFVVAGVLAILLTTTCFAQNSDKATNITNTKQKASLYYLGDKDQLLIKVNIWGFVQKPGQYFVPTDTDLISLISFAGGPREEAKLKKVKLIRNEALLASYSQKPEVHLAMNGSTRVALQSQKTDQSQPQEIRKKVIEINVKDFLKSGDESLIPDLLPGDTIVVEGSTYHLISKFFDFATKLAVIAQVYWFVQVANR